VVFLDPFAKLLTEVDDMVVVGIVSIVWDVGIFFDFTGDLLLDERLFDL
jgi:hypothetical protein